MPRRNVAVKGRVKNTGGQDWSFYVQLHVNNPQELRYWFKDYTQTVPVAVPAGGVSHLFEINTTDRAPDGGWWMERGWKLKMDLLLLVRVNGKWEGVDSKTFPDYVEP